MSLQGKHALVTGGGRGIGRAIAERLARDGATVVLTYAQDRTAAEDTAAGIGERGGKALAVHAPFGDHGDAERLWRSYDEATGRAGVDIVVNNAGIGRSSDIRGLTEDEFDKVFAVNVRAPFFVVQGALSRLRDHGRVINISSGVSRVAKPDIIAYAATRRAGRLHSQPGQGTRAARDHGELRSAGHCRHGPQRRLAAGERAGRPGGGFSLGAGPDRPAGRHRRGRGVPGRRGRPLGQRPGRRRDRRFRTVNPGGGRRP